MKAKLIRVVGGNDQGGNDQGGNDQGELAYPVSGGSRVGADGRFQVEIGGLGEPRSPVTVAVAAPQGYEVFSRDYAVEEVSQVLRIPVRPGPRFEVTPSDEPGLGQRLRLTGQVVDRRGGEVPAGLPVVIWEGGRSGDGGDPPARPLLVATTQAGGHFSMPWTADRLEDAAGRVAGAPPVPVPLDAGGRLPRHIVLVIELGDVDHAADECPCDEPPPRAPDPSDLTANPEAFSQDLGGGCVDLTVPNRVLEEFAYFMAVRTSEPRVTGVTLGLRTPVPDELLTDLLGVSIASLALHRPFQSLALDALPRGNLSLDVVTARQLVRTDQPPTVTEIGRATWLSEVGHTKRLIGAGLQRDSGRTVLDADHPIDWDDTPTIHVATEIAHGHLLQFREVWRADGYSLGSIVHSLPLAPGQRRQIAVLDWDRRTRAERTESLQFEEDLDAVLARDRDVTEMVGADLHEETSAGSRNTTWGVSGGIGAGFVGTGFGIFGGVSGGASGSNSTSWQQSARTFSADSMQSLRDRVSQRSSALRSQRSAVVQSVGQEETVRAETEVVANYNRCHAITIEFFQVLRHFLVSHELADVQECLFVPLPISEFDRAKALRWREPLRRFLKDRRLRGGFEAIERVADNWEGSDYPEARYSEEPPESLEGELRISFLIPRPRDAADGAFQVDMWAGLSHLLDTDALALWTAKLNGRTAAIRDRVYLAEIAPMIAKNLVNQLRFAYVTSDGGETEVPLDATLVSRYSESVPLYISINPAGALPPIPREEIAHFKVWYEGTELPPEARVVVESGRVRYRSAHSTALLFDDGRVLDDIRTGDPVIVATPVSSVELRNPREDDVELADRLVAHLNEHLEFYHQAIWATLDPQRRYMLLDAVLVPGTGGKSIAGVCSNELVGIVGNTLVLPLAPGQRLDPTLAEPAEEAVDLVNAYAGPPSPPLRISVPTRGVYAEAVAGACNSCEAIDDSRYWRWTTEGQLALPEISEVSTESRAAEEPDLTPTPLPAPLVSIQNAPAVPDPFGLSAAFQLISKPDLFRDITGLEGTQKNAAAAFDAAASAASALGGEAAKLAGQQMLGQNAGRMLDRINQARSDGLISDGTASQLADSALRGLIGESRTVGINPLEDPTVAGVIEQLPESGAGSVIATTPSETVEVEFDSSEPVVGSAAWQPKVLHRSPDEEYVDVPAYRSSFVPEHAPQFLQEIDLNYDTVKALDTHLGGQALGLVRFDDAARRYTIRERLHIVYPENPASPGKVAGEGRLPLVLLVHGNASLDRESHLGYRYIQEVLAEQGFVSVSVDMNVANLYESMIEMRARMVMQALDTMRALDSDPSSLLRDRLDLNRVGLMGHSRGGDAVIRAAELNRERPMPDWVGTGEPTRFGIAAICALASTDLRGAMREPIVLDAMMPFLAVVHGALDSSVSGYGGANTLTGTGFRHYDRALCEKAMVFLDGCNHGRFNERWDDEKGQDPEDTEPGGRLLSRDIHKKLAIDYIGGLFGWKLIGKAQLADGRSIPGLFDGSTATRDGVGVSVQWSFGQRLKLDEMEPGDPPAGSRLLGAGVEVGKLAEVNFRNFERKTNHQTSVVSVPPPPPSPPVSDGWRLDLPPNSWVDHELLTLRAAADFDVDNRNVQDGVPRFTLIVGDAAGKLATVESTELTPRLRPPVYHFVTQYDGENPIGEDDCTALRLETVVLPLERIAGTVDLTAINTVALRPAADSPRHMFFDSIQLVRR